MAKMAKAARLRVSLLDDPSAADAFISSHCGRSVRFGYEAATSANGRIGAIDGDVAHGGAFIWRLSIVKEYRRSGLGSALMTRALADAKVRHAAGVAQLTTFDFQGPTYYPKLGFVAQHVTTGLGADGQRTETYFARSLSGTGSELCGRHSLSRPPGTVGTEPVIEIREVPPERLNDDAWHGFFRDTFDAHAREETGGQTAEFSMWALTATLPRAVVEGTATAGPVSNSSAPAVQAGAAPSPSAASSGPGLASGAPSPDDDRVVVGAVSGMAYWRKLVIEGIAMAPFARHQGIGRALLAAALDHGRTVGCVRASAHALDSQSPAFLSSCGWQHIFSTGSWEGGQTMHFFEMPIDAGQASASGATSTG